MLETAVVAKDGHFPERNDTMTMSLKLEQLKVQLLLFLSVKGSYRVITMNSSMNVVSVAG